MYVIAEVHLVYVKLFCERFKKQKLQKDISNWLEISTCLSTMPIFNARFFFILFFVLNPISVIFVLYIILMKQWNETNTLDNC